MEVSLCRDVRACEGTDTSRTSWLTFWKMVQHGLRRVLDTQVENAVSVYASMCGAQLTFSRDQDRSGSCEQGLWISVGPDERPPADYVLNRVQTCYDAFMERQEKVVLAEVCAVLEAIGAQLGSPQACALRSVVSNRTTSV